MTWTGIRSASCTCFACRIINRCCLLSPQRQLSYREYARTARNNRYSGVSDSRGGNMCFRPAQASMPVKCPACGAITAPDTGKCEKCGASLADAKPISEVKKAKKPVRCPTCNSINPGTAQTCSKCGGSLEGAVELGAPSAPSAPAAPTSAPGAPSAPIAPGAPKK